MCMYVVFYDADAAAALACFTLNSFSSRFEGKKTMCTICEYRLKLIDLTH